MREAGSIMLPSDIGLHPPERLGMMTRNNARSALMLCAFSLGGAAAIVGMSTDARAQSTPNAVAPNNGDGLDAHLFRPAMDSKGLYTTNGSEVLGHNDISF